LKLPNNLRLKIVYRNAFCCGNIFIVYWRILKISFSQFSARLDFSYLSSLSLYALLRSCLSHRLIVVGLFFASNWKLECWFEKSNAISRLVRFDSTREVCKRGSISSVFLSLSVIRKWRHAILDNIKPPPSLRFLFYFYRHKIIYPHPKAVTFIMDEPLPQSIFMLVIIYRFPFPLFWITFLKLLTCK